MANYDGFEKASYYGNKGERVAIELLERNGFTTLDVSSNPNFFPRATSSPQKITTTTLSK